MQAVHVLDRVDPHEDVVLGSEPRPVGICTRNAVQAGSAFNSSTTDSTSAWDVPAGRSRRMLATPISAQSLCLALTYQWLAGSSPTSTVPRQQDHGAEQQQRRLLSGRCDERRLPGSPPPRARAQHHHANAHDGIDNRAPTTSFYANVAHHNARRGI